MRKAVSFSLIVGWYTWKEGLILLVTCKFLNNQWPNIYTDNWHSWQGLSNCCLTFAEELITKKWGKRNPRPQPVYGWSKSIPGPNICQQDDNTNDPEIGISLTPELPCTGVQDIPDLELRCNGTCWSTTGIQLLVYLITTHWPPQLILLAMLKSFL